MTQPYSQDLRERALARGDRGETIRSIAAALEISASCVSKWRKLRRETGALKPGKMNGHKKPVLRGPNADWLRERVASYNANRENSFDALTKLISESLSLI